MGVAPFRRTNLGETYDIVAKPNLGRRRWAVCLFQPLDLESQMSLFKWFFEDGLTNVLLLGLFARDRIDHMQCFPFVFVSSYLPH